MRQLQSSGVYASHLWIPSDGQGAGKVTSLIPPLRPEERLRGSGGSQTKRYNEDSCGSLWKEDVGEEKGQLRDSSLLPVEQKG